MHFSVLLHERTNLRNRCTLSALFPAKKVRLYLADILLITRKAHECTTDFHLPVQFLHLFQTTHLHSLIIFDIPPVFLLSLHLVFNSITFHFYMSNYCIYLKVPSYLDQWLRHDYWNPTACRVEFERGSNIHSILSTFLRKRPADFDLGNVSDLLPVDVPTFKGMNPDQHNFLGRDGEKAIVSAIKRNFKTCIDKELSVFYSQDISITDIIYAFMESHGIDKSERNWEAIRQMYYRLRGKSLKIQSR